MNPGDIITVDIESINSEGEGVARFGGDGFVLFVIGALPGEKVACRVTRTSKKYAAAVVVEILSPSNTRVKPKCPSYDKCGGCQLQHVSYEYQLEIKKTILTDALQRLGKIEPPQKLTCIPSPEQWAYRNKTVLPVQAVHGKSLVCGYYERRSHRVVEFMECAVLRHSIEDVVNLTVGAIAEAGLTGYDERKIAGDVRHIAVRSCSHYGGELNKDGVLVGIVAARELSARELGRLRNVEQRYCGGNKRQIGAVLNIKTGRDNFIWGPVFKPLCGKRFIDHALNGYRLKTDISMFFQINSAQAEIMFEHVKRAIRNTESPKRVLELYSGVGSLTVYLAEIAEKVDAVEEQRHSSRQMKENLALNGIGNVEIHEDSAENFMQRHAAATPGSYDTIILDPPRTGCDERVIEGIKKIAPQKIVYISCNPATLARDISRLMLPSPISPGVYTIESLQAFDMFPQTAHVESVAVMTRG
jgi:23S rRNA (uracil1939-C5)-methyltransferase